MQAVFFGHADKIVRLIINILVAGIIILTVLSFRHHNLPKVIAYKVFREYERINMNFKTRYWNQIEGTHFVVKFQTPDVEAAKLVLDNGEEIYRQVNEILGFFPKGKAPIILYPNTLSLNRSFGWAADESTMGVYWAGVIRILSPNCWIEDTDKETVFRSDGPMAHEYAHYVVDYITGGNYPRWLTEGIAQQVERKITGYEITSSTGDLYPLSKMDKDFDLLSNQNAAYRQSLAMVDFLVNRYGANSLEDILWELRKGDSLNAAFKKVLGIDTAEFELQYANDVK